MRAWFCTTHPHTMLVKRAYSHGGVPGISGKHANPMLAAERYCPQCYREWLQSLTHNKRKHLNQIACAVIASPGR